MRKTTPHGKATSERLAETPGVKKMRKKVRSGKKVTDKKSISYDTQQSPSYQEVREENESTGQLQRARKSKGK